MNHVTSSDATDSLHRELETRRVHEPDCLNSMHSSHVYYNETNFDRSQDSITSQSKSIQQSLSNSMESHEQGDRHIQSQQVSKPSASGVASSSRISTVTARKTNTATASGRLLEQIRSSTTNYKYSGGAASAEEVWKWIRNRSNTRVAVQNFHRKLPPRSLASVDNVTRKKDRHRPIAPGTGRDTLCLLHLMYKTSEHNRHAAEQLLKRNGLPPFAQPQAYNQYDTLLTDTSNSMARHSTGRQKLKYNVDTIREETSPLPTSQSIHSSTIRTSYDKHSHSQGHDRQYTLPSVVTAVKHRGHSIHNSAVAPRGWEPLTLSALKDYAPQCDAPGKGPFLSGQPTMWRMPQLE